MEPAAAAVASAVRETTPDERWSETADLTEETDQPWSNTEPGSVVVVEAPACIPVRAVLSAGWVVLAVVVVEAGVCVYVEQQAGIQRAEGA